MINAIQNYLMSCLASVLTLLESRLSYIPEKQGNVIDCNCFIEGKTLTQFSISSYVDFLGILQSTKPAFLNFYEVQQNAANRIVAFVDRQEFKNLVEFTYDNQEHSLYFCRVTKTHFVMMAKFVEIETGKKFYYAKIEVIKKEGKESWLNDWNGKYNGMGKKTTQENIDKLQSIRV